MSLISFISSRETSMTRSAGPVTMDTLPPHVPPELVRPYPFHAGQQTTEHPFRTLIPSLMDGPAAFYSDIKIRLTVWR